MPKFAYIMRGIPGSGKSSTAHAIASAGSDMSEMNDGVQFYFDEDSNLLSAVHSTDTFFLNKEGEYVFRPFLLGKFHSLNFKKFKESLAAEVPIVICDNTNTTRKEYMKYLEAARRSGYITSVITMPHPSVELAVERNTHNVPEEAIVKMLKRWESYNGRKK